MVAITFNCPKCEQQLEAPTEMAGETVECPNCNQPMVVPAPVVEETTLDDVSFNGNSTPSMSSVPNLFADIQAQAEKEEAAEDVTSETGNKCPECGADMTKGSVLCMSCGFHKGLGKKLSTDLG